MVRKASLHRLLARIVTNNRMSAPRVLDALVDNGVAAIGCPVFPGGIGQTEQQVAAMVHFQPAAYTGTPDFL